MRLATLDWPLVNIWCPQTKKPRNAMAKLDMAIKRYPKMRLRLNTAITSLMMPIAGKIMM